MKQLGNLAIVCAQRPDVLLQLYNGMVSVHFGTGPSRKTVSTEWDDDAEIIKIIQQLNFGGCTVSKEDVIYDGSQNTASNRTHKSA